MAREFSNLRLDCSRVGPTNQSPPWGMFNLRITRIAISDMIGRVLQDPPPLTNGQYPGPTSSKTREHSIDVAHQRQGALWPRAGGAFFNYWILWISIEITEGWNMPKHLLYRWQIPPMSNNLVMPTYCLIFAVLIAQLVDFCSSYCTTDCFSWPRMSPLYSTLMRLDSGQARFIQRCEMLTKIFI